MTIRFTTHRVWELLNLESILDEKRHLQIGDHEMERRSGPTGDWLVMKGTSWGLLESQWRSWSLPDDDIFQVKIEEDVSPPP